jgi:hypothetical protein
MGNEEMQGGSKTVRVRQYRDASMAEYKRFKALMERG